jgi:FkbM family methyltransferase
MGAHVVAIEPHPDNFKYLMANTEGAKNLKLVNALLFDGNPVLFRSDPERNELHKVIAYPTPADDVYQSVRLDNLIRQFGIEKIDLLKMDIEGSEYTVLYDFDSLDIVQQLTIEWHYGSTNLANLILFLEERGLQVVWLGGNGQWGKLQCKRF